MATTLPVDIELNYKLSLSWRYDSIEFLGLPHLKDNRSLKLGEIFIPLRFKSSSSDDTTLFLPKLLKDHKHLVVLGDPGCGKSTLVKQITHSFSTSSPPSWTSHFGNLLPIPIILREYRASEWKNYEDMLGSFIGKLDEGISSLITVEWLTDYLAKGQAVVLLDGIDEIGSAETRRHLRDDVVFPLVEKFPESYFILTSRIIGYDEVRFDEQVVHLHGSLGDKPDDITHKTAINNAEFLLVTSGFDYQPDDAIHKTVVAFPMFGRCYVSPFNNEDIEQFITRWYTARESDPALRSEGIESLKRALAQNDRVKRLASNASLLTLIALIFRITADLPSGRVKLYDKITEAYLETIEKFRGVGQYPATLEQKRRWLARVGWKMQSSRTEKQEGDLLAADQQVKAWLTEAIAEERDNAESEATAFLDYIARRSGLLIPRGVDDAGNELFSFVHLTFQEYFAALHLRGIAWDFTKVVKHVQANLTKRYWHETILVLFELLADLRGSGDRLVKVLIEKAKQPRKREATAEIFSQLLLDSESGLSPAAQQQAAEFASDVACEKLSVDLFGNSQILNCLKKLSAERQREWIEKPLIERLKIAKPASLKPDFFLVGDEFISDWPQQIENELICKRSTEGWESDQLISIAIIGAGQARIIEWLSGKLPIHYWLKTCFSFSFTGATIDDRNFQIIATSAAELNLTLICNANTHLPKNQLLAHSGMALATNVLQISQVIVMARSLNSTLAKLSPGVSVNSLDPSLASSLARSVTRSVTRSLDPSLIRLLDQSLARQTALILTKPQGAAASSLVQTFAKNLAQNLTTAMTSSSNISTPKGDSFLQKSAMTEWLAFQLDQANKRLTTVNQLQPFLKADDDWTRLMAINNLITLSAGTPELVRERNRLCDLAMKTPDEFTFPAELVEATKDKEWFNLPEIIRIIFLHKPGHPFLKPEWFDPKREESKFFLSPPREFFALAAEVLDPKGETELAKWRK